MTNEQHWTDDEEVLEDYVLERMEASVRALLDAHLNSCEHCQTRLESEAALAAGIRQFAARTTRVQLQASLTAGRNRSVPLPHILSMAAAIVIIVGIGFYNRWFWNPISEPHPQEVVVRGLDLSHAPQDTPLASRDERAMKEREDASGLGKQLSTEEPRKDLQPTAAPSGLLADKKENRAATVRPRTYDLTGFLLRREVDINPEGEALSGAAQKSARQEDLLVQQDQAAAEDSDVRKTGNLVIVTGKQKDDGVAEPDGQIRCSLERVDSLFYLTIFITQGNFFGDSRMVHARLAAPDSLVLVSDDALIGLRLPSEFKGQIVPAD